MTLAVGTLVGVYEVLGLLGAGGMGEVYRARDRRLNREVALKVLPDAFASEPERLARFEREAQVLASLNHPHIATVYGFDEAVLGQSTRIRALAMELVPGETLAARLARGRLPVAEALDLARQIAQALEAAHELGVVHRDLKPANIHVTPNGTVKVLDFGLAKLVAPGTEASGSQRSHSVSLSPTITSPVMATSVGVLLGTAAYMAPEQAKGREAGPRSDIWAFGCVLFEMLTGQSPFRADDVTETLAAILMRDPDWSRVPADTPINVQRLLKRCLRREPGQRLHSIADARIELEDVPLPSAADAAPPVVRRAARLPWVLVAVALLLVGALFLDRERSRAVQTSQAAVAFAIAPPAGATFGDPGETLVAIAPDGQTMVLTYTRGGLRQLFRRRLDQLDAVPISGTERASGPFFSPDGRWLAFTQNGKLRKVAISGGSAIDVGERAFGQGAWNSADEIVYTPNYAAGLWRVAAAGGTTRKLTEPATKDGELGHWHPQFLPDGKTVLFTNYRVPADTSRIEALSIDTGQRRVVVERGMFGRYLPTGHLLFSRGTTVFAMPFDADRLAVSGNATPMIDGVAMRAEAARAHIAVSASGTLVYVADADLNPPRRLAWVTPDGSAAPLGIEPRRFVSPELSPDGRTIAAVIDDSETDIWIADIQRGVVRRVTDAPGTQASPVWAQDSRRLFYASEEPAYHVYQQSIGAAASPERLVDGPYDALPSSLPPSADGLLYTLNDPVTRSDIWLLPLTGERKPRALVKSRFAEGEARVSPDGRWLAYVSDESGRSEVYAQAYPDGGDRIQVSIEGGSQPRWSADGRQLFFRLADQMLRVSVGTAAPLTVSRPVVLFRLQFGDGYSVARDGRFLVAQRDPEAPQPRVNVILNWSDRLRARLPVP